MYKKIVLGLAVSALVLGWAGSGLNAQAEEVEGSVWIEAPESVENNDTATASDEVVVEEEPEMWPVYLSLGAISITLLLVAVINLSGRRYSKK